MKRLFFVFLFLDSIICSKNQNDVYQAQIDVSSIFSNNNSDNCTINTSQGSISIKASTINEFKNSSLINSLKYEEKLIIEAIIF